MDEQKQDYIDRYIRKEMSEEERRHFEMQLLSDPELQEQYEFTLQMKEALKSRKDKLERMRRWEDDSKMSRNVKHRSVMWGVTVSVAVAAVLVAGIFLFSPQKAEMPPLDDSAWEVYRSAGTYSQIVSLIQQERYAEALQEIERQEQENSRLSMDVVSAPLTDEERERMEYEQEAARQDADHLRWLKVYALMGLERREEALEVLDSLRKKEGIYQGQADSLYRMLK